MQTSEVRRAVAAALSTASALDLTVDDATVLHDSNRLVLRLWPCDVVARVAPFGRQGAQLEVEFAQRLAATESPVVAPEPRVEPRVYQRDGFAVTLWTYYEPVPSELSPADYRHALWRLHAGRFRHRVRYDVSPGEASLSHSSQRSLRIAVSQLLGCCHCTGMPQSVSDASVTA